MYVVCQKTNEKACAVCCVCVVCIVRVVCGVCVVCVWCVYSENTQGWFYYWWGLNNPDVISDVGGPRRVLCVLSVL